MSFDRPLQVEAVEGYINRWIVLRPFFWRENKLIVNVPAGFITDFGSIPLVCMGPVVGNGSDYAQAYTLHDWLYRYPQGLTRLECDAALDRAMLASGAWWPRRKAVRAGLLIGGWIAWGKQRREDGRHCDP